MLDTDHHEWEVLQLLRNLRRFFQQIETRRRMEFVGLTLMPVKKADFGIDPGQESKLSVPVNKAGENSSYNVDSGPACA